MTAPFRLDEREATLVEAGPFGVEVELARAGVFRARVFLSRINCRIRVLAHQVEDHLAFAEALTALARSNELTKVFLKVDAAEAGPFHGAGFLREAALLGFFDGRDAEVLSLFLDPARSQPAADESDRRWLADLVAQPATPRPPVDLPAGYSSRLAQPSDAEALAALYGETFVSYPFPVDSPDYLRRVMDSHVSFRLVRDGTGRLVAAASAEMDREKRSVEMTDFATRPDQRGRGLAQWLLSALEEDMRRAAMPNRYSLTRADSRGMNLVFHRGGYSYTGSLLQNCTMGGRLQDMICWCKRA